MQYMSVPAYSKARKIPVRTVYRMIKKGELDTTTKNVEITINRPVILVKDKDN